MARLFTNISQLVQASASEGADRSPLQLTPEAALLVDNGHILAAGGTGDVLRHADELFVTVGPYRRSLVLPDSLKRREVRRAQLVDGELRVTFGLD